MANENDKESQNDEFQPLTEEERQALIERARREIPELRRQSERGLAILDRIAAGEWRREGRRPIRR